MINVVLLMDCLAILIFENLSKNSFGTCGLRGNIYNLITSITIDTHASSMYSVELILNIIRSPRRSLSTSSSCRVWIIIALSD